MAQVPAVAQTLARHVLSHEASGSPEPDVLTEAAQRVEWQLRERLAELIGLVGYTTLVARALHLAQAEIPTLGHITVSAREGSLSGIRDFVDVARVNSNDPHAAEAGLTAILANVIGLLITFIGEDLALRLVRESWPDLGPDRAALEGLA